MTREEFRQEKEKMKKMSGKDRVWYLWNYYRVPILIGLVVLFLLCEAAGAFWRSRQDCMLYCVFLDQTLTQEEAASRLKEDFYTHEDFSGRQILTFDFSIHMTEDQAYGDASVIVFQSLLATQTVDIVILRQDTLEQFRDQNIFLDLEEVLPEELLNRLGGSICYAANSSGNSVPMGLYLKDSLLPSAYSLDPDSILCVCTLDNHPDVIADFVEFGFFN